MTSKKIIFLFTVSLVFSNFSFGQPSYFCFDRINARQSFEIEQKFHSIQKNVTYQINISEDYIPNGKKLKNELAQPLIFNRPDSLFSPGPQINYFYLAQDSTVKLIEYTWDTKNNSVNLNDFTDNRHDQRGRKEEYNKKFDSLLDQVTASLGRPTNGDGKPSEKKQEGYGSWTERRVEWHSDKVNVELFMIWTENKGTLGTFKIRVKTYWP